MGRGGGPCGVCENNAHLRCSGCGQVHYCGIEHQKKHWPQHRQECLPFKVISSPEAGRYLVSSRKLEPGSLILQDVPLVVGPLAESPLVCLGCSNYIEGPEITRCPTCYWPMCCVECASSPLHKEECQVLAMDKTHFGAPKDLGESPFYDIILTLRCLLMRDRNPVAWQEMMSMSHHAEQRVKNKDAHHMATVQYIIKMLRINCTDKEVNQVKGAVSTNAVQITTANNTKLRAMYPRVRLFNHSCLPNIQLSTSTNCVIQARATTNIEPGESLNICYTVTTEPLWERLNVLQTNYYFVCECKRCSDPTENGTHFSSPPCPECKNKNFLEARRWLGETIWICPTCHTERKCEKVRENAEKWLAELQMDDIFSSGTYKRAQCMLDMVEEEYHKTHFLWMKVAQMCLYKMRNDECYQALKLKRKIWQRLADIYDKLEPGICKRRGEIAEPRLPKTNPHDPGEGHIT